MSGDEYVVIWQREGQEGKRRQFFQTRDGAFRCAERQRTASEEIDWAIVKPLIYGPFIRVRAVEEWRVVDCERR